MGTYVFVIVVELVEDTVTVVRVVVVRLEVDDVAVVVVDVVVQVKDKLYWEHNNRTNTRQQMIGVRTYGRFSSIRFLTTGGAHKKPFPKVDSTPPRLPQFVGRCRSLNRAGPHGHRVGQPLSRLLQAGAWGHV